MRAVRTRWKRLEYRADWLGHDEDPIYYPASNFKYALHLLQAFHLANPTLLGPLARLLEWIRAYDDGIDNYDDLEGDLAMDTRSRASFFRRGGGNVAMHTLCILSHVTDTRHVMGSRLYSYPSFVYSKPSLLSLESSYRQCTRLFTSLHYSKLTTLLGTALINIPLSSAILPYEAKHYLAIHALN